jgi:hypothetical protein
MVKLSISFDFLSLEQKPTEGGVMQLKHRGSKSDGVREHFILSRQ